MCLAVTCHLHFWQNDSDLLRATAVTRGWNRYRNKSQHRNLKKMPVGGVLQGAYFAWKATAMGKNQVNGKTFLEKRYDALWHGGGLVL